MLFLSVILSLILVGGGSIGTPDVLPVLDFFLGSLSVFDHDMSLYDNDSKVNSEFVEYWAKFCGFRRCILKRTFSTNRPV